MKKVLCVIDMGEEFLLKVITFKKKEKARVSRSAEQELRIYREQMNTILDFIQSGIIIVDAKTHVITFVNSLAAEIIGQPAEEIIGSVCHKYVCPAEKGNCPITDLGQKVDKSKRMLLRSDGEKISIIKSVISIFLNGREQLIESFLVIDPEETKK